MKGSSTVVQNALNAALKQRIRDALGVEPDESLLKTLMGASPELQKQLLLAMRTAMDAERNAPRSPISRGNNGLAALSSDALNNLKNELIKSKELTECLKRCEHGIGALESKLQASKDLWTKERQKEDADLDELRKASDSLHDKVDKQIADAEATLEKFCAESQTIAANSLKNFIDGNKGECEDLKSKLKDMLATATVATLSSGFDEKRKNLLLVYIIEVVLFISCLGTFCYLGIRAISDAELVVAQDVSIKIAMGLLNNAPYCLPLFWLTCHINKLMNQSRRLMEEYAHKVVVAQTYTGMARQVEELANKGVVSAKELSEELMASTIRVLCANPNSVLDKVKTQTPLSEVTDCVSKLANAASVVRNPPSKPDGNN